MTRVIVRGAIACAGRLRQPSDANGHREVINTLVAADTAAESGSTGSNLALLGQGRRYTPPRPALFAGLLPSGRPSAPAARATCSTMLVRASHLHRGRHLATPVVPA
jgi:hypothetical protein